MKIETEKDFKKYSKKLKKLVDAALENARKKGYVLAQGYWIQNKPLRDRDDGVCLDGYVDDFLHSLNSLYGGQLSKKSLDIIKNRLDKEICNISSAMAPTICPVGAIGLYKKIPKKCIEDGPGAIAPLIRNGSSECISEEVLHALSDGFECGYNYYTHGENWWSKYLGYAYSLGQKFSKKSTNSKWVR